ncbi:MAG: ferredoxin--nitrite reductase, partial [Dehalococcoidia bacterium]
TSQQSGMDNVRNVVGCPLAGLAHDEAIDTRPLAARLQQAVVRRDFSNLPRKFNISLTGCTQDCAHAQTHDLSFTTAERRTGDTSDAGFNVWVGGALGGQHPMLAEPLDAFVTPRDVVRLSIAVLEVFRDHGLREKRQEARLKWLLKDWGIERFRAAVAERFGGDLLRAGESCVVTHGGDHIGVEAQRQTGLHTVGLLVPVGRITATQIAGLADLADRYGSGEVRLTVQQNVLLPGVAADDLDELLAAPLLRELSPQPSAFLRGLVSCTGNDYCHFSLIDTKGEALRLARALDERYEVDEPVRIQMSGCPHACGQHRMGDIGLQGDRVRLDGVVRDAAHVFAGGQIGLGARLAQPVASGVPVEDLPTLVARQIEALRGPGGLRLRVVIPTAGSAPAPVR